MPLTEIAIRGAREHNLKSVDLDLPHNRLIVVTGLSGSGKSSLAFDTVYAEGQRKYMESLSAYARQFLDQLQKPKVETIEGLPPTIAIEQRGASHNPRSTVATTTEVYDYLRLLFARCATPRCWAPPETGNPGKATKKKSSGKSATGPTICGEPITGQSATQIVDDILMLPEGTKFMILAPVIRGKKGHHKEIFASLAKQGFVRARVDGEIMDLREIAQSKAGTPFTTKKSRYQQHTIEAVIDRLVMRAPEHKNTRSGPGQAAVEPTGESGGSEPDDFRSRVVESVELSLKQADGIVIVSANKDGDWVDQRYSEKYACPHHPEVQLDELEPRLFSFNSPFGACGTCGGLGRIMEFDPELIVPNPEQSLGEGAIEAWRKNGKRMNIHYSRLLRQFCRAFEVDPDAPFKSLSKAIQRIVLHGTTERDERDYGMHFEGVIPNLQRRWDNTDSEYVKHRLSGYLSEAPCEACQGARLRPEALHVFLEAAPTNPEERDGDPSQAHAAAGWASRGLPVAALQHPRELQGAKSSRAGAGAGAGVAGGGRLYNIHDITQMTIEQAADFFDHLALSHEQATIAEPILKEIKARLGFMLSVGLGYLNLNRATGTLSGGEGQRIRLATQVGSGLVGCCYVLDEPTIGLHQRDNDRLIRTLRHLTDIGNTVVVVEHDEDTIRAADYLVDIGPGPGRHGGEVVAAGPTDAVVRHPRSLTAEYLRHDREVPTPAQRRVVGQGRSLVVKNARENNLRNLDVAVPLGGIVCVTGVSGSGKSTLVNQILLPAIKRALLGSRVRPGAHDRVNGTQHVERVIEVDQSPIGRTPRSNPATYTGVFDNIRELFTNTREGKVRGYKPGRFSFNVKGGRCEACQGQGVKKIEMHFLPDVFVQCDVCKGKRYNRETLEITYRGKHIADVLDMTVEEALEFFDNFPDIKRMLRALNDVGLSYVQLGQASTTLSGGEAQRVKLATELGKRSTGHTLYILDEPTTGLHFEDVRKLVEVMHRLCDEGNRSESDGSPMQQGTNMLVVIEHNMDVIKCADWVLDLGPEGGDRGGTLVAQGTPEDLAAHPTSYTGQFLKTHLERQRHGKAAASKRGSPRSTAGKTQASEPAMAGV